MIKRCTGCGVILQSDKKDEKGYVKKELIDTALLCERCFRLKNYNEMNLDKLDYNNDEILEVINKKSYHTFFIIDFFHLSKKYIDTYKKIKTNKTLIISKSDLIFNSLNKEKIKKNIAECYDINEEIIFVSIKNNASLDFLKMKINKYKKVFFAGYTNEGKSSLLNVLTDNNILTSIMPNTTLDFIEVKSDNCIIVDSPGFIDDNNYTLNNLKKIYGKKYIKPIVFPINKPCQFEIENILSFAYIGENKNSFIFYINNDLSIKKSYKNISDYNQIINIKANSDLVIKGIGFINIKKDCILNVLNPDLIEVRKSLINN